jgi:two-component system response regulator HydG
MLLVDHGVFDLVVTDIRMPNIDGIELIERIVRLDRRIAVVAISAFGTDQTAMRARRAGALDYLAKPFLPEDMARCIERVLQIRSATATRMPD